MFTYKCKYIVVICHKCVGFKVQSQANKEGSRNRIQGSNAKMEERKAKSIDIINFLTSKYRGVTKVENRIEMIKNR